MFGKKSVRKEIERMVTLEVQIRPAVWSATFNR
jgi:hypothetical protein